LIFIGVAQFVAISDTRDIATMWNIFSLAGEMFTRRRTCFK